MTYYAAHDDDTIYAVSAIDAEQAIAYATIEAGGGEFMATEISQDLYRKIDACGWDGRRQSFEVINGKLIETTDI